MLCLIYHNLTVKQDIDNWDEDSIYRWFRQKIKEGNFVETYKLVSPLSTVVEETQSHLEFIAKAKEDIFRPDKYPDADTDTNSTSEPKDKEATALSSVPHLLMHSAQPCKVCESRPDDQKCLRYFLVDRNADAIKYKGAVLTQAGPDDRLKPKVYFFLYTT